MTHPVYRHLEALTPQAQVVPTAEQVLHLISAVKSGLSTADTVSDPLMAGWTTDDAVDCVAKLGQYLARSSKKRFDGDVIPWNELAGLFPPSAQELPALVSAMRKASPPPACPVTERDAAWHRQAAKWNTIQELLGGHVNDLSHTVVVAHGWTPQECARGIVQSYATVSMVDEFDGPAAVRFVERTYTAPTALLSADHVFLLVWLASNGQLERLLELGSAQFEVARLFREAWDVLETANADARRGLGVLLQHEGPVTGGDVPDLAHAVSRAYWLNPGEIGRVRQVLPTDGAQPGSRYPVVEARLRSLRNAVRMDRRSFCVNVPDTVTIGQARLVCETAGLITSHGEEKAVKRELQRRLTELGLVNDLDREVGEGLRAWRLGLLEEFYRTRAARSSGDMSWADEWHDILASA